MKNRVPDEGPSTISSIAVSAITVTPPLSSGVVRLVGPCSQP
jgi:hypothetical protein